MNKKKAVVYGAILLVLGAIACWIFYEPEHYPELKEKIAPGEADAAAAKAVAEQAIRALADRKIDEFRKHLQVGGDPQARERIEEFVLGGEQPFAPADVVGCDRLKVSHRKDNVNVYVFSRARKRYYAFALVRNQHGVYHIVTIGGADKSSAEKFAKGSGK